ncbi:MAG: DUF2510 domain-containing protein [Mycobacterium sp.]
MTAPGWYPDPLGGQGARYWDGTRWEGATDSPPPAATEEFPEAPTEPAKPRRLWPLWTGLIVAVCVAAGSLALVLTRPTDRQPAAATATPTTPPPTVSPAEIAAANVRVSMQRKLDSDPDLSKLRLKVVDVVLINKSGNEYKGIATVKTPEGEDHDVPVEVTADKDNTLWETPPGAFVFAQDEPPSPPKAPQLPPPVAAPSPVENFKICPSGVSGVASDDTSCAFADIVRESWYSSSGNTVIAYSPVTGQEYVMHCAPATTTSWPVARRCVGANAHGTPLIVYISVG